MSDHDPHESAHAGRQRAFYENREHRHLQADTADYYCEKLVRRLVDALGIGPQHRVLELGAGFGRFTFHLLNHCRAVSALDISPHALRVLIETRDALGIAPERCQPRVADLERLPPPDEDQPFDFVVGFFILHHLRDFAATIRALPPYLGREHGGVAFVEPNRRNPLFLAQVACCPDMTWKEERGMFTLGYKAVEEAFASASLAHIATERFGFFPPQLLNRFTSARRLESRLEKTRWLEWVLPMLLCSARISDAKST